MSQLFHYKTQSTDNNYRLFSIFNATVLIEWEIKCWPQLTDQCTLLVTKNTHQDVCCPLSWAVLDSGVVSGDDI